MHPAANLPSELIPLLVVKNFVFHLTLLLTSLVFQFFLPVQISLLEVQIKKPATQNTDG
jgi:hypothetical protein